MYFLYIENIGDYNWLLLISFLVGWGVIKSSYIGVFYRGEFGREGE